MMRSSSEVKTTNAKAYFSTAKSGGYKLYAELPFSNNPWMDEFIKSPSIEIIAVQPVIVEPIIGAYIYKNDNTQRMAIQIQYPVSSLPGIYHKIKDYGKIKVIALNHSDSEESITSNHNERKLYFTFDFKSSNWYYEIEITDLVDSYGNKRDKFTRIIGYKDAIR